MPALVIPPWRRDDPLEYSEGIRPTNAANGRGDVNRVRSPSSVTTVIATNHCYAPERLQGLHDRKEPPGRRTLEQLGVESLDAIDLLIDSADGLLKDDLLRRRGTDDLRQIPKMRGVPVGAADVLQS